MDYAQISKEHGGFMRFIQVSCLGASASSSRMLRAKAAGEESVLKEFPEPVYVVDVAAAIVNSLKDDGTSMGKSYGLGGPEIYTVHDLAELMYETICEWPRYIDVPLPIARICLLDAISGLTVVVNSVAFMTIEIGNG
uniref:NmrA-like domain-containing protein n=1 Tax=Oryza nivara TaxID=4536 RepID=A0A0E0GQ08_ORYNI